MIEVSGGDAGYGELNKLFISGDKYGRIIG